MINKGVTFQDQISDRRLSSKQTSQTGREEPGGELHIKEL